MVDKNSSLKNSFFDDFREGVNVLPPFLDKPAKVVEQTVEELTATPAKSGVTTGALNLLDPGQQRVDELELQKENNAKALARYQQEIQEINKLIPQKEQEP